VAPGHLLPAVGGDRRRVPEKGLEGRLETRKWTDKEGKERYTTEIIASEMKMLGSRAGAGAPSYDAGDESTSTPSTRPAARAPAAAQAPAKGPSGIADMDDDIPF
jgi:single-strand DNA-binding protein